MTGWDAGTRVWQDWGGLRGPVPPILPPSYTYRGRPPIRGPVPAPTPNAQSMLGREARRIALPTAWPRLSFVPSRPHFQCKIARKKDEEDT